MSKPREQIPSVNSRGCVACTRLAGRSPANRDYIQTLETRIGIGPVRIRMTDAGLHRGIIWLRIKYYLAHAISSVGNRTFAVDIDGTITEDGSGRIHLGALSALRSFVLRGHRVIFVTGRSSVEAYILSVFGGTTPISVGENGGCITTGGHNHVLLGDIDTCMNAYNLIESKFEDVRQKPVFPRMTEVVVERTFDLEDARRLVSESNMQVTISDSGIAYHINSAGVDKASGFRRAAGMISADLSGVIAIGDSLTDLPLFRIAGTSIAPANASDAVKSEATIVSKAPFGGGVVEALNLLTSNGFEVQT